MIEVKTVAVRPCYREKWQGLSKRKGGRDMTEKVKLTGRCMCGAVEISGVADGPKAGACHCDMCRRWSSGPYFEVTCGDVVFRGEDSITRFRQVCGHR